MNLSNEFNNELQQCKVEDLTYGVGITLVLIVLIGVLVNSFL